MISTYVQIKSVDCLRYCVNQLVQVLNRESFTTTLFATCICLKRSFFYWKQL